MSNSEAPILSTPATHVFEEQVRLPSTERSSALSEDGLYTRYEITRTLAEIRKARYTKVALQFPDSMLPDAPRVVDLLRHSADPGSVNLISGKDGSLELSQAANDLHGLDIASEETPNVRYYILADTSYGACCVDEIAAEHVNAEVVVHYGRACMSPTSRIPVIHVFTIQPLERQDLIMEFGKSYPDRHLHIILMADVTYRSHLREIRGALQRSGYTNLFMTEILSNASSPLPNCTVPEDVKADPSKLRDWHIFHISDPPESLLLTLASRVASICIFSTSGSGQKNPSQQLLESTNRALNRRYALLTSVNTVSIFGILINTLSVKNYLHIVEYVKDRILAAGKKSYTFVVGKVNSAKVANFSEIGAWVVIGCWESSLIDSKDFWKPVLTPFELELALQGDKERVWTGEWSGDFQQILDQPTQATEKSAPVGSNEVDHDANDIWDQGLDSEPESVPPEFDLRTGRYVSHSRPMQSSTTVKNGNDANSGSLIKRAKGDLAVIGGKASPGADHLRSNRMWRGLGSDFEMADDKIGAPLEQGRSGIARGYTHGEDDTKT